MLSVIFSSGILSSGILSGFSFSGILSSGILSVHVFWHFVLCHFVRIPLPMETLHGITVQTEMCFTMAVQATQNTAFGVL